mmetsp:Transcript_28728/g.66924  ORF Transcript_28728/g.66924 Transcript_28728/m.66924 type:complete len:280 (+) Transcript_28728:55-894(+)
MTGSIWAAALLLVLLRATASTCQQSEGPVATGHELQLLQHKAIKRTGIVRDTHAELHGERESTRGEHSRLNFSTSTSYCYEQGSSDCWASKPSASTPVCTASSGGTLCRCPPSTGAACAMDQLHQEPATTGRCQQKVVYVPDGRRLRNVDGQVAIAGSGEEVYCRHMVKNDQWEQRHIVNLPSDPPAENDYSWLSCWRPNTWKDGKCQRRTRYLGERCWGSMSGAGHCAGSDVEHSEYSTSCYGGVCVIEKSALALGWAGTSSLLARRRMANAVAMRAQ